MMVTRASVLRCSFILVVAIAIAMPAAAVGFDGTWSGKFFHKQRSTGCIQTGTMILTASNTGNGTLTWTTTADPDACAALPDIVPTAFRGVVSGNVITTAVSTYTFTLTNSTGAVFFSDLDDTARFYATLFPPVAGGPPRAAIDGPWTGTQVTNVVYCDAEVNMTGDIDVTLQKTGNAFTGTLSSQAERDSLLCILQDYPSAPFLLDLAGTISGNRFTGKATYGTEPFEAAVVGTINRGTIDIEACFPTSEPDGSNEDEPIDSILRSTLRRARR